jgi:hypothetical protein
MLIRTIRKMPPRILTLTAIALTLGIAGGDAGVVVCFGDDGHVAIEASRLEGCAEASESAPHTAPAVASPVSSSHCGPCVDIALTTSSVAKNASATKRTGPAPAVVSLAALAQPVSHLPVAISHLHTTGFSSEKPHTVVIRC